MTPRDRSGQDFGVDVGCDFARFQAKKPAQLLFELDAMGDLAVEEDPDHAFPGRAGDQPMRLDVADVEPGRDLALGQAADVVKPSRVGCGTRIVVMEQIRFDVSQFFRP